MKKLALLLCGLGSLVAVNASAMTYASPQNEPQYQEQCVPAPCVTDTVCNQVPCNVPANVPCNQTGNVQNCTPAPCVTPANASNSGVVPCVNDTTCNPAPCVTPAPSQTQAYNGCC